jgi:hypothetical protein
MIPGIRRPPRWIAKGESVMKTCYVSLTLLALACSTTGIHASTTSGVVRFTGLVFEPASAAAAADARNPSAPEQSRRTCPLSQAQAMLSSDVLDYFATYAAKDAKMVSVAYK